MTLDNFIGQTKKLVEKNLYSSKGTIIEINKKFVQDVDYYSDLKILKKKFQKIKKMKKKYLFLGYGLLGTTLCRK